MRSFLQFLVVLGLMTMALSLSAAPVILAQGIFPLESATTYGVEAPPAGTAQVQVNALVLGLMQNMRYILGAVAIALGVFAGFKLVIGWGNEDTYTTQKRNLFYVVIGLTAVGLAGELAKIFSVEKGTFLKDPNQILRTTILFNQQTQIIITFIKYFIGGIAVLMIVRNGFRMITMGEAEDKIALDKKNLLYSIFGLVLIIIADTAINKVFYVLDLSRYPSTTGAEPAVDPTRGVEEIVGATNFMVALLAPIAIIALVAGGVMYMTAAGNEEQMTKAKRLLVAVLAGIILIYGAFAIVSTFIAGSFE